MFFKKLVLLVLLCVPTTFFLFSQNCLGELFVEPFEECNDDGTFNMDISFENISGNDLGFDLLVNGELFDSYSNYPEIFVTVENVAVGEGQEIIILIVDIQNPECGSSYTFTAPNCESTDCNIFDANFQTTPCDLNNINVLIDFEFENTSEQFILGGAGGGQVYNYGDVPFYVGPFEGNGSNLVFEIVDQQTPDCFEVIELALPNCEDECEISNILFDQSECDENGNVTVVFNFAYESSSAYFILGGAGGGIVYTYVDLPLILNDIPANGETLVYEIIDGGNENCFGVFEVELLDCENICTVNELFAEVYEDCNDDGTFNVDIEFEVTNGNESGFDVFVNGEFHSYFFSYPSDFVTIVLDVDPNEAVEIMVADNDNENCFATYEITSPDCAGAITNPTHEIQATTFDIYIKDATLFIQSDWMPNEPINVFIFNSTGSVLLNEVLDTTTYEKSLKDYPSGIYFVTLKHYTQKIFIP